MSINIGRKENNNVTCNNVEKEMMTINIGRYNYT